MSSIISPKWPIKDVENEKRHWEDVQEDGVNLGQSSRLVEAGNLFLALVQLRSLVQKAVLVVNHCQISPLLHQLKLLLKL